LLWRCAISRTATLRLVVKTDDPRPIFKQIVDHVSVCIASGELQPGDKLPSVRALAIQLSVNPNTVSKSYAELATIGLVDSRQGLGLFIATPKQRLSTSERKRQLNMAIQNCVNDVLHLHFSDEEIIQELTKHLREVRTLVKAGGQK
jgi:GntR family transcriptional regulator